jgi:hypothetical protein
MVITQRGVSGTAACVALLIAHGAAAAPPRPRPAAPPARAATPAVVALEVVPASLTFQNRRDVRRALVLGVTAAGERLDLTGTARFSVPGGLVEPGEQSYFTPRKVGSGTVLVAAGGRTARLPVRVVSMEAPPLSFVRDVAPVLSKAGCNSGTCHGAAKGKNGFKLSLRGYDLEADYHSLVDDVNARRFNRAAPDQSLMLLKPTQEVPHQGGLVFERGSRPYNIIRQWIVEGARTDVGAVGRVARLEVLPRNPTLTLPGRKQNLVVLAHYPDGSSRDVTRDARFASGAGEVAEVTDDGLVTAVRRGESPVLVSYEGQFATSEFTILGDRTGWKWQAREQFNYIDRLVDAKLQRIKGMPAPLATDAEFLRRVHLDLTGLLPTPEAARAFLADARPSRQKRLELIDRLLQTPEFDDHWTYKLAASTSASGVPRPSAAGSATPSPTTSRTTSWCVNS